VGAAGAVLAAAALAGVATQAAGSPVQARLSEGCYERGTGRLVATELPGTPDRCKPGWKPFTVAGGKQGPRGPQGQPGVVLWRATFPAGETRVESDAYTGGGVLMDGELEVTWTVPRAGECPQFPAPVTIRVSTVGAAGEVIPGDDTGLTGQLETLTIDMPHTSVIHLEGFREEDTTLQLDGTAECLTPTGEVVGTVPVEFVSARALVPAYR
jgi:hypothetical protein